MSSSIYTGREHLQRDPASTDPKAHLRRVTEYELRNAARYRRFATVALISSPRPGLNLLELLSELIRGSDEAVRLGDAVAILMGETDASGATAAIRRFRQRCGGGIDLCCAFASYPSDGRDAESLLDQAWTRHAAAEAADQDALDQGDRTETGGSIPSLPVAGGRRV